MAQRRSSFRKAPRLLIGLLGASVLLTGCIQIDAEEPWVRSSQDLEEELHRSAEMNDRLRERALVVQGAR